MARENVNVSVNVRDNASKPIKGIRGGLAKLSTAAKVAAVAGIGVLTKAISASVKAFGRQEAAETKLKAALQATGQEVENNSKELFNYASELQKITTVGDEASIEIMQIGVNMGLTAQQTKQATRDAIGMSKAYGVNVQSAMRAAAAAQEGNYSMMQRYIPALRGMTDQAQLAAKAQELMGAAFDVAKAETQTFNGSIEQLSNAFGDAQEAVGAVFAPMIQRLAITIRGALEWFNDLSPSVQRVAVIVGVLTTAIAALLPVFGVLAGMIAGISLPVLAGVAGVAALTAGFFSLIKAIRSVGGVLNFLRNLFIGYIQFQLKQVKIFLSSIKKMIDLINKVPGINIPIGDALENIDKLNEKLEDKKAKRIEIEGQEEDEVTEQKLAKEQERFDALQEQEDGHQAIKDAKKEMQDEIEKQLATEKDKQEKEMISAKSDFELEKMGFTSKQIAAIRAEQNKQMKDDFDSTMGYLASGMQSKNKEIFEIGKAASIAQAIMSGAQAFNVALASAPPPFNFALAAGVAGVAASKVATISSTQMAEGGVVMPTRGGTQATIGEAGSPEAVIPLDDPEAQGMLGGGNVNVFIDSKPLARELYEVEREMIRTGELTA